MGVEGGRLTRRGFVQGMGALGLAGMAGAAVPEAVRRGAGLQGKVVSLIEDGGFVGSAWGWQMTGGAALVKGAGRGGLGAIHVKTGSGDYGRFLVLGPKVGVTYTVTGWVKTEGIVAGEAGAGAYFAASQFEFQGRPTEFTVDGKQAVEVRYGNWVGTSGWQRFSQTVTCLPTTAWFEVVVGVYRASGEAWFCGVTFVEGTVGKDLEETVSAREAAEWAHRAGVRRDRPRAAVLEEAGFPVRGDARRVGGMLGGFDVEYLNVAAMGAGLTRERFDLLVLCYGEVFPLELKDAVMGFLAEGGDLLTTGGYAFQAPVVRVGGGWRLVEEMEREERGGANLVPGFAAWKRERYCGLDGGVARVAVPGHVRRQTGSWSFDLPVKGGEGAQYFFSARWRRVDVAAAPDGLATIGVEQLDAKGEAAYAARLTFGEGRGSADWAVVERLFYLVPECVTLRVKLALTDATGMVEATDVRLEARGRQVRINTALGWPEDSLTVDRRQLGMFDADYKLKRVARLRTMPVEGGAAVESKVAVTGYAASGVVGMNYARWVPVLEGLDAEGRRRGAAGAVMHHHHGPYTRSSWAFFGVDAGDWLGSAAGVGGLRAAVKALLLKCSLHSVGTEFATYRAGEAVRARCLVSNYGLRGRAVRVRMRVLDGDRVVFSQVRTMQLRLGETRVVEEVWRPAGFAAEQYGVRFDLLMGSEVVDSIETAFNIWKEETLAAGMAVEFKENYFQVAGRSVFLQGTDDYLHTFIDQDEHPGTWLKDARGCRDSAIDVYENLMGLRGPQHRPTETWWRWVDAMLLNTQRVGGIFFPGMLVFSNTAVSDVDLEDQKAYVKAFAKRYGGANGIMYYLNGDLQLHDPNLPDLQRLYRKFLQEKYGTDEALRAAWRISPPDAVMGKLTIHGGGADWADVRTRDDFQFRTSLVRRWLNAMHEAIREVDTRHPVTAEFYQSPVSGIDLLSALGKLELANFGYFNEKDEDYYRFPQICRFLDQSVRGKGINVGEFGVKTHPAWNDTGYYIEARTEAVEQQYFLSLAHYGFGLGASKIQNWCWKYPADLPFEWGINYPNEMVPRDVRAFYRNSGLLFRSLRPKYESSETVMLLASDHRMGGQGHRVVEGQLNAIRLLMDENVRFSTLSDEFLAELPAGVKTILYPLPFCPSDAIVEQLKAFVRGGGRLYLSGDLSFDGVRERTRTGRLREMCGVEFVSERYAEIEYGMASVPTKPAGGGWPEYDAAPTMVMRTVGATVLLADVDGHPVVTEFGVRAGRVVFSADPVELHGDPRYQGYAHGFYRALIGALGLESEAVEPQDGTVHCFRVASQDARVVRVVVNHGVERREVRLANVRLALGGHLPGVVVSEAGRGVQAVESSGDVFEGERLLVASDLHAMVVAFGREGLAQAGRVLVLPMGTGTITLHTRRGFVKPVLLLGEIVGGRWMEYSATPLVLAEGGLAVRVTEGVALGMLLVCEAEDRAGTVAAMERWVDAPWTMEERV